MRKKFLSFIGFILPLTIIIFSNTFANSDETNKVDYLSNEYIFNLLKENQNNGNLDDVLSDILTKKNINADQNTNYNFRSIPMVYKI